MFNYDNFRQKIRENREILGYTQEKLAEKADLDSKFLAKVEIGFQNPSTYTIIKILNTFNSNLNDFLENDISKKDFKIQEIKKKINLIKLDDNQKELLIKVLSAINKKEIM